MLLITDYDNFDIVVTDMDVPFARDFGPKSKDYLRKSSNPS